MNKLMSLLLAVALAVALAVPSFAQGFSADNKPTPIFCDSGSQNVVAAAATAGTVGTAFSANPARLDGELINNSTNYLMCSLTSGTTTGIAASYFVLYPTEDSYARDRYELKRNDNVYRGALYFIAVETPGSISTKGYGKVSFWEWK